MTLPEQATREFIDRAIRESLQHPEHLRTFLEQVGPDLAPGFDCERARLLSREFPMDDWRGREADLPFEIPYRVGAEELRALVCVLIEHQSDTDPVMPLRLLYFAVVYWERQWYAWKRLPAGKAPLRLSPVLPIVLYTGTTAWGSSRKLVELFGEPTAFHAFVPAWEPLFWNLADRTPEALLDSGRAWLQTLAVLRAQQASAGEFARVVGEAFGRVEDLHGKDHPRWYDLLRFVWSVVFWRRPRQEHATLRAVAESSQKQAASKVEVRVMGQTIAEALIEEGMAKGKAEGKAEGELSTARAYLRKLLVGRFGPLPESLIQRINSSTDLARLEAAFEQGLAVKTLDDLKL